MMGALAAGMMLTFGVGCAQQDRGKVKRYGQVIGIRKEAIPEYKRLHAECWPGVLEMIEKCHIRNYSIFLGEIKPEEYYLFAYFEYTGDDLEKEVKEKMENDPITREWWAHTDPLQYKLITAEEDEWWHTMEEVFHTD